MKIPCETCVDEDHCTYNGSCYKHRVILREKAKEMHDPVCPFCGHSITHGMNGYCSFFCAVESKVKKHHRSQP